MVESDEEHMAHTTQKGKVKTSKARKYLKAMIVGWTSVSPNNVGQDENGHERWEYVA
jgi:hypothetical protein